MKVDLYNQKAEKVGDVELNDSIFNAKVNDKVLAQYVYIYLSNQRQGNANTKDKSEVRGGGKKPFAQKGTGRARAGSTRSPIWKGGGVTHGPTSEVNWTRKTTKSFRKSSIKNALSKVAQNETLRLVKNFEVNSKEALTKQAVDMIKSFGAPKKITLVSGERNEDLINSFSNLKKAQVIAVNELNAYNILNSGMLVLDEKALEFINQTWGN